MILGIIFGVILIFVMFLCIYIGILNRLRRLQVKIDEALSGIDVALTKRYDVLTKMRDAVKGYMDYEKDTILKTIELRSSMNISEKKDALNEMNRQFSAINALAENYPDLKASENYKELQGAIINTEEHLQAARRAYNANVSEYNQMLVVFPSNIIASSHNMTKSEFFEADDIKKDDVKIEF